MGSRSKSKTQKGTQRKLPSGRWQAFVKHNGEVIKAPQTFLYEHEAIAWSATVKSEILTGVVPKESSKISEATTFESFYHNVFVATRTWNGAGLKPGTVAEHAKLYRNHLKYFSGYALGDITFPMVHKWYKSIVDTGHLTTASKAYKHLQAVFRVALKYKAIRTSPCLIEGAGKASTGVKQYHPSSEDVQALANAINPRYKALVLFGAYSGLRFGELAALVRADLELKADDFGIVRWFVSVNKAVTIVNGRQVLGSPKSDAGNRIVPLGSAANFYIKEYLSSMPDKTPQAVLFPDSKGRMPRHDTFIKRWNVGLGRIGKLRVGFTPHALRRYAATEYANASGNLDELCKFLGDSTKYAASGYIRSTNRASKLADKVPNIF
jgi:integrase